MLFRSLQKLQAELNEKKDGLKETEYDKYISDQEDMLDKLYGEYNEAIQKKMDDFMGLVQEGLDTANKNTALISDRSEEHTSELQSPKTVWKYLITTCCSPAL